VGKHFSGGLTWKNVTLRETTRVPCATAPGFRRNTAAVLNISHRFLFILCPAAIYWCQTFNILTPNVNYRGRTAPLTSKVAFYTSTEYFKRGIYSPFFSLQKCSLFHNSNVFGSCIIHILYTGCAKIKKKK